jgi:hypothetical protein
MSTGTGGIRVEPPGSSVYTEEFGQPTFQILPAEETILHEDGTWPAGTWVPIQAENKFHEDSVGKTYDMVEPPDSDYGQPIFQILPA